MLYVSGQLPFRDGALMTGRLGEDVDLAFGQDAAQRCALMIVAQMKAALGGLHRVERILKLGVFVNSTGDFTEQAKVANGASDLMFALFGEPGRHARKRGGRARAAAGRRGGDRRDRADRLGLEGTPASGILSRGRLGAFRHLPVLL